MTEEWKSKAPKQATWFSKHPTQILKQAKRVWKWSVEVRKGKAWIYYIFAICRWLPTNYRLNYSAEDQLVKKCKLCLCNTEETMDHILCCPALLKEQLLLKENLQAKLKAWEIPYASIPLFSREGVFRNRWKIAARDLFSPGVLSPLKLDLLTKGFWKANRHKQFIPTQQFLKNLSHVVRRDQEFKCKFEFPRNDLVNVLIQELTLQTHGLTGALHYCSLFEEWSSTDPLDVPFGASLWSTSDNVKGSNSFFFLSSVETCSQELLETLMESLDTKDPTRCVCMIPRQDTLPSFALEVATFPAGSPLFGYDYSTGSLAPCAMSIILVLNKESLAIDPINWESLTDKLCALSQNWTCAPMTIAKETDFLFRERISQSHHPRVLSKQSFNIILNSSHVINFYDAFAPKER